MRYFALLILITVCTIGCKKSSEKLLTVGDFQFTGVTNLPNILDESSGLEVASPNSFWSFNDSNGKAELYEFDTLGTLLQTAALSNAINTDWEDITKDKAGNLYIGDFGNNGNDRQDLVIYKILHTDLNQNNIQITASIIGFNYPEQTNFPPPESDRFYDVEAMFAKNGFLYLLTRDRSKPFIGKTTLYRLPDTPGNYEAELLGDFFTDPKKSKGQITAADFNPGGTTLVMISNEVLWLFQNIEGEDFFSGEMKKLDLPVQLDMEGVVFLDDCTIYMCNENKSGNPAILYKVDICR